ncbi:uncharacterized protein YALI1_D17895g [Yarrowia lipolytica]|uniref:Uncharacterized protein n=1 Tax=Yarrowia lipolytica TaxID=4952 RepID=A0A1D8NEN5_YARLL|nr:hypothetical protein YALI1_D17895g [Yarrowia lipolytica]
MLTPTTHAITSGIEIGKLHLVDRDRYNSSIYLVYFQRQGVARLEFTRGFIPSVVQVTGVGQCFNKHDRKPTSVYITTSPRS